MSPNFPTILHKQATETITDHFLQEQNIDTILLTNSIARGKATPESDIDMAILVSETTTQAHIRELENSWQSFLQNNPTLNEYINSNRFAQIHLDIIDGVIEPIPWEDGVPADSFELEIGNRLLYSLPLTGEGVHFQKLKLQWLPYYHTELQTERLKLSKDACLYEIVHIPIFVRRGLYFQAFDRLYVAFQKFLQALFIKHKTYPIAYNKWIKEQIIDILHLPRLYKELPPIISVTNIESDELNEKAEKLHLLLEEYCD